LASQSDKQPKDIRAELESLLAERMECIEGKLEAKFLQSMASKLDERLQFLGDNLEAKKEEVAKELRMLDNKVETMDQAATSHLKKLENAAENHLEALSKSATSSMKRIRELAEVSAESITKKYDDIVTVILPFLQPSVKQMAELFFQRTWDHRAKIDEEKNQTDPNSHCPPSPTTHGLRKKDQLKVCAGAKSEATSRKRQYSDTAGKINFSQESPSDRDGAHENHVTLRRSARRAKRVKGNADKENKTPSSKIHLACVTPSGENPQQLTSPLDRATFLRAKKASDTTRNVKATGGKLSKSDSAKERIPFEVIAPNIECPSPLGDRSAQLIEVLDVRPRETKRRRHPPRSKVVRGKRSRTYGKRSCHKMQEDSFSFF
jgi:hypothetical protein